MHEIKFLKHTTLEIEEIIIEFFHETVEDHFYPGDKCKVKILKRDKQSVFVEFENGWSYSHIPLDNIKISEVCTRQKIKQYKI